MRWAQLTSSLSDLGIARAPSRTPRQLRAYYDRAASLEGAASEALGRVTQTLEISRYAAPGPVSDGLVRDARDVLRAAAAARRRRDRVRAAFLPSEGFAQLRAASANIAWRASAPWRGVNDHVERWLSRRR